MIPEERLAELGLRAYEAARALESRPFTTPEAFVSLVEDFSLAVPELIEEVRELGGALEVESARTDSYQRRCGELLAEGAALAQELEDVTGRFRESPHLAPKYYARAKAAEAERAALAARLDSVRDLCEMQTELLGGEGPAVVLAIEILAALNAPAVPVEAGEA